MLKNADELRAFYTEAANQNADLVITPEGSLTGYPLDDLVLRPSFIAAVQKTAESLAETTKNGPPMLIGVPVEVAGKLYNAALLLEEGKISRIIQKRKLPNYGPFHEKRHFEAGDDYAPIDVNDHKVGVAICEDIWYVDVAEKLKLAGAEAIVVMNASPFEKAKQEQRLQVNREAVEKAKIPLVSTNLVGGQDELVFDGGSFAMDERGNLSAAHSTWQTGVVTVDLMASAPSKPLKTSWAADPLESTYEALVLSVRDYAHKNGFKSAVLGISGGIDSALTNAVACDALGPENVHALMLGHDRFTSDDSHNFARETCEMSGSHFSADHFITRPYEAMAAELEKRWEKPNVKETYENVQARLRTLFLFAVSNEEDHLVLNTSNKSEVAMGHSTFYGDTSGGFAPLKDVWKLDVYALAKWRNENTCRIGLGKSGQVIHQGIIGRPPTPELGENEIDTDLLPPYEVLDPILKALVEDELDFNEIMEQGFDYDTIHKIAAHLQSMQFKRFQTPPGPKVSPRSFGHRERMYPLTSGFL